MIEQLIEKQDNWENVRDQIAAILASEISHQKVLAIAKNTSDKDWDKSEKDWDVKIFSERSNPWEFIDDDSGDMICNVWFDSASPDQGQFRGGDTVERQFMQASYNLDCYGRGFSSAGQSGGHLAGDLDGTLKAQRAARLVRNILMAAEYIDLGLKGVVGKRMVQSITSFRPEFSDAAVQPVQAVRLVLEVAFNEFSPQIEGEPMEYISININRSPQGEILAEADYDYR